MTTTTDDDDHTITCRHGAAICRGVVAGKAWQKEELQRRYSGIFSWYLEQKIKSRKAGLHGGSELLTMTTSTINQLYARVMPTGWAFRFPPYNKGQRNKEYAAAIPRRRIWWQLSGATSSEREFRSSSRN